MHSLTHVCCILLIDYVYFMLGNVVPEPFFEDFQDQAFDESQLFFVDQQDKLPWTYYTYGYSLYSVELELHDRKVYSAHICYCWLELNYCSL
jgi:hypothetical protein